LRPSIFLPSLAGGGAERVLLAASKGLAEVGHDVCLVLGTTAGPLRDELPDGVRVIDLESPHLRGCAPALARHVRQQHPTCIIAGIAHASVAASVAVSLARTRTPIVPRLANTHGPQRSAATSWIDRLTMASVERVYRRAPLIIVPSQGVADDLVSCVGIDPATIRVIPNPVVTDFVVSGPNRPAPHRFFAPGQPPVVMAAGRFAEHKGLDTLLDAFQLVHARRRATLLLLGEGPERPRLLGRIRALGLDDDVDAPGFDPDPFPAMARAAVYVLASEREGSPGALIQALACGPALVSTDCPSGPREVLGGGRWGRLVPVGDAVAMADAIDAQLDRGRERRPDDAWSTWTYESAVGAYDRLVREIGGIAMTPEPVG
jgi:glycosyltransferase involved in cell wall biosynthesis